jgi:hypothetical protein
MVGACLKTVGFELETMVIGRKSVSIHKKPVDPVAGSRPMRLLLDECVPAHRRHDLTGGEVQTVPQGRLGRHQERPAVIPHRQSRQV